MTKSVKIAIVGCGHGGLVAAVCFAEMGHDVICVDNDTVKIAALQSGATLIHEEHLPELLERHHHQRLRFTTDLGEATRASDAIFIAVGTPQNKSGEANLCYVEAVAKEIAHSITTYKVIVERSTVPVCTNDWVRRIVERNGTACELFDVVSNPEFLREGAAVSDFLHPDRLVVGVDSERAATILAAIYRPLTSGWYYDNSDSIPGRLSASSPPPLLVTSTRSAEIIKHSSNAFIAMKISFINAVSNLCEATGANVEQVAKGMGLDTRIGTQFLKPGIGYGGSAFGKDLGSFRSVAAQMGVDFSLLTEVERINVLQKKRFVSKVRAALWTLRGKRLAVLGLAFKGGTDDIRESAAIDIVTLLLAEGSVVNAYDPAAMERAKTVLTPSATMKYAADAYAAAAGADALLVLSDWQEFANLDLVRMRDAMRYPIVIDGRNLYEPHTMAEYGFAYASVGRADVKPAHAALPYRRAVSPN